MHLPRYRFVFLTSLVRTILSACREQTQIIRFSFGRRPDNHGFAGCIVRVAHRDGVKDGGCANLESGSSVGY